ncbi:hypothetical protein T484DRAFT_1757634 [Baffinella frigidus]|nr:hypothetical protein T484DRAFT_1757634 [Cryptophyta sp. CCMP2293]
MGERHVLLARRGWLACSVGSSPCRNFACIVTGRATVGAFLRLEGPHRRAARLLRTVTPPQKERVRAQPSLLPLPESEGECLEAYVQAARGYDEVLPGLETAEGARATGPGVGILWLGATDSEGNLTLSARATLPCRENRTMGCSSSTAASSAAQPVSQPSNQVPSFILGSLSARTVSFILWDPPETRKTCFIFEYM